MTKIEFWEQFYRGAASAFGEGPSDPFGIWPHPSLPQPDLRKILPITHTE